MQAFVFGQTSAGLPIQGFQFGSQGPRVLVLGGVHGNEPEGVALAQSLLSLWESSFPLTMQLTLVPMFNLDGILQSSRVNARGVDLNRNLPTKDWSAQLSNPKYPPGPFPASEPENQGLLRLLESHPPQIIYSLHSWHPVLNVNGDCRQEAEVLARHWNYRIDEDIGYPTPGCLGTYCGLERKIPTLTVEIERGLATDKIVKDLRPGFVETLKISAQRTS